MILDLSTRFSSAQAVTVTAISTNVVDLRPQTGTPALVDEGIVGGDLWLVVQTGAAATAAGAATVTVTLESDSDAALSTSPTVHYTSPAFSIAQMAANSTLLRLKLPSGNYERYLGLRYTVATGPLTAGTFTAFLTPDINRNLNYPSGFSI